MLKIGPGGGIHVVIDHLLLDRPTTLDGVVHRYNDLDITLFYHVVSSPTCRYERTHGSGRIPTDVADLSVLERFKGILREGVICGHPKGYFVNKHRSSLTASQIDAIKSVSFALCSTTELAQHFTARDSAYGICFFHDFLEQSGIRPVVYLNDHDSSQQQQLVFNSPYLVEAYGKAYDMRWEHEWRVKKTLAFSPEDVAFLIVPDNEYRSIIEWLQGEDLDYTVVMPSSVYQDHLRYLLMLPRLDHSNWRQIRLFDGMLLDFDEFKEPTQSDRQMMRQMAGTYLACLVKADVHEQYEYRFTERFLAFLGNLDDGTKHLPVLQKSGKVAENANEPWHSSRDLVIAAYEELFKIQQDRITAKW